MAAHVNAVENLIIFAPLVLTARALSITTAVTGFACALYFWSRLVHVGVYTLGIPVLRTLSFAGGFLCPGPIVVGVFLIVLTPRPLYLGRPVESGTRSRPRGV